MKKRVLATVFTVCLLFGALACVASAASVTVGEIVSSVRICPGKIIDSDVIDEPVVKGYPKGSGWEIQKDDGLWVPYDGQPLTGEGTSFNLRYFTVDYSDNYEYSNVCVVRVAHNPIGDYQYSGTDHWRVCDDCGGQAEKEGHTHLKGEPTAADKVCKVCGHVRTPQYTGILSFIEWFMAVINVIIGMF